MRIYSALPLDSDSKPWSVILKRGSRGVYSILNEYSQTPKSVCKWDQLFAQLNWGEIFCKPILTTKDTKNVQTDRSFDLIILMAKFHIFKSKLQKGKPNVNIFIHSLKQRAVIEKYRIAASDQEERHETQPLSLADLLCLE